MEDILINFGYFGLFGISFVAATLFPLGSEAAVVLLTASGWNPLGIFLSATLGNVLGAFVNYGVGRIGDRFVLSRFVVADAGWKGRAERIFSSWGAPVLFFAWAPVIGDPLTVVAGVFRINLFVFTIWVTAGKSFRYWLLILAGETLPGFF